MSDLLLDVNEMDRLFLLKTMPQVADGNGPFPRRASKGPADHAGKSGCTTRKSKNQAKNVPFETC